MLETATRHDASAPAGSGWVVLLAGLVPFVVYLRTMAPTVYGLDSAELTTGAYVLGLVHAPGAPTFLLLAHLFTWLPFGDVGYRVNLLSVSAAAAAVAVLCAILLRLTRDRWVALGGAWCLAFSFYYWVSAVAAELYSLHALFIALCLWLALRWRDDSRWWWLGLFALTFGVGLGNHLTLVLLAPGLAYLLLADGRWRAPSSWAVLAGGGLLGSAVYLYLPIRALAQPPMNYARDAGVDVATLSGFWWMVRGGMFQSLMFGVPLSRLAGEVARFVYWLWSNFLGLGCLIGLVGVAEDRVLSTVERRSLLLMLFGHLGFVLTYAVLDKDLMMVPAYFIWAIWIALGAVPTLKLIEEWWRPVGVRPGVLLLGLAAISLVTNFRPVDISDDWSARRRGEAILATMEPSSLFIGSWADVPILEYLSLVEGRRTDVETKNVFFFHKGDSAALARRTLEGGRAVYTSLQSIFARSDLSLEKVDACDCYRVGLPPR